MKKYDLEMIDIDKCPVVKKIPPKVEYIMLARVKELHIGDVYQEYKDYRGRDHEDILVATFYSKKDKKPIYRVFISDESKFITLKVQEEKWSNSMISNLLGWNWRDIVIAGDKESAECGVKFLNLSESDTLEAINNFQRDIRDRQLGEKHKKLKMSTDAVMEQMQELPDDDMFKWINNNALLSSRYIYYKRKGKVINGFCTSCKKEVIVKNAYHNEPGKCPNCKSKIIFKAEGKSKNVHDYSSMAFLQKGIGKLEGSIIIRCFRLQRTYYDHYKNPETGYREEARYVIKNKIVHMFEFKSVYSNGWQPAAWHRRKTPYVIRNYFLYSRNLSEVLKNTMWQYSGIKEYAAHEGSIDVLTFLEKYIDYPSIEYLVKLKLFKIVTERLGNQGYSNYGYGLSDSVNFRGKNIKEVLGIEKNDIPFLQKMNIDTHELKLYKNSKLSGHIITNDILKWVRLNLKSHRGLQELMRYTSLSKIIKYLDYQDNGLSKERIAGEWNDYIINAEKLGYDIKSESVLFPKDLKVAHDRVADLVVKQKNEHFNEVIQEIEDELNKLYGYKNKEFIIRAPHSVNEIIDEGSKLKHCVGTYIDRVARKETIIMFIRKSNDLEEPYYTMEIKKNEIAQIRGLRNCRMTPEVEKFINGFKNKKLKKINVKEIISISA